MKLITNKSKNLLYRIQPYSNCNIQFGTSYAIATQISADSLTALSYNCQYRKDSTYLMGAFSGNLSKPEKITRTFTTPADLDYNQMVFGVNGKSADTLVAFPIKLKPSTTYTFTCNFTNITQGSISWKDMMLVEGDIAGDYEPYSYNLLDKWRYAPRALARGVLWNPVGDGSVEAIGALDSSQGSYSSYYFTTGGVQVYKDHIYICGNKGDIEGMEGHVVQQDISSVVLENTSYANRFKVTEDSKNCAFYIATVKAGYNIATTIQPFVYDLTEMYRAGNEPASIEAFFKDHPELKVSPLGFIELKNLEISNKNIKRLRYKTWNNNLNLIDRNDFKASELVSGVTFTNNGDGSWTLNGTSTSQIYWDIINSYIQLNTSHKYLLSGCPKEGSSKLFLYVNNGGALFDYDTGSGSIGTPTKTTATITINIAPNTTVNNAIFKPRLYDLTEIYGAGKEPTTVEQFYNDHPLAKTSPLGFSDLGIIPSNSGYILNKYNDLSEELLEENVEKDTVNYHIPDKTNISLNKVEGKTNKIVQEIDKTVFATSGTKAGLTFTCNRTTGSVTVNGTATASSFWNPSGGLPLVNNHKYLICGNYDGIGELSLLNQGISDSGSGAIGTAVTSTEAPRNTWGIAWDSGTTFNNVTIYPQVFDLTAMYGFGNEPTTVEQFKKDYPQFFDEKLDSIWNVRTSGVSTTGKNLFVYDQIAKYDYNKDYKKYNAGNAIFFKAGTYSITTKNVNSSVFCQAFSEPNIAITDIFSVLTPGDAVLMYKAWNGYAVNIQFKQSKVLQFTLSKDCYLTFCADPNVVTQPMIELGTVGTDYEPYQENKIDLLNTQTLYGINGVNDYIEVIDKGNGLYDLKKTQNIDSVDLGTLDWIVGGLNFSSSFISQVIKLPNNNSIPANCVCDKYVNCSMDKSFVDGDFGVNTSGVMQFRNSAYTTAAAFKTAMNGVILYYQLKTPVITTITRNLTYNQVSAVRTNGGLLLVNDNNNQKYAQPNVIIKSNYQYKS